MQKLLCSSWISGKHDKDIEINTRVPFISIYEFYAQGQEAEDIIKEINRIFSNENLNFTPLEACKFWATHNL
jgi:hypothetical protein